MGVPGHSRAKSNNFMTGQYSCDNYNNLNGFNQKTLHTHEDIYEDNS